MVLQYCIYEQKVKTNRLMVLQYHIYEQVLKIPISYINI